MEKTRDLTRTREKILKAAMAEFAANGLSGARCGEIAHRARVNKRMLFYCFGSKENLYREIVRRKFAERATLFESIADNLAETITHWYEAASNDFEWVRLLEWEALSAGRGPLVGENERRDYFRRTLTQLRRAQQEGHLPQGLDLVQLLMSIVALTVFPLAFPQMTRLATGLKPTDPRFRSKRLDFLQWLGGRLSSEVDGSAQNDGPAAVVHVEKRRPRRTADAAVRV